VTCVFILGMSLYKVSIDLVVADWSHVKQPRSFEYAPISTKGANSTLGYAVMVDETSRGSLLFFALYDAFLTCFYTGHVLVPAAMICICGWQVAWPTIPISAVNLVLTLLSVTLAHVLQKPFLAMLEMALMFNLWLLCGAVVGRRAKNCRILAMFFFILVFSSIVGISVGALILPMFVNGGPHTRVLVRVVMGTAFAKLMLVIGTSLTHWGSKGEGGVACTIFGKWFQAMICYCLRLMQSSVGNLIVAVTMEAFLQLVQIAGMILMLEFGGLGGLTKKLKACMQGEADGNKRWWLNESSLPVDVASNIVFKEYLDLSGAFLAMLFGLMIPYTMENEIRTPSVTVANGIVQLSGELISKGIVAVYVRARVAAGVTAFPVLEYYMKIPRVMRTAMPILACSAGVSMITATTGSLCWAGLGGGQWMVCTLRFE